jgi:hypothetical protein
MIAEQLLEGFEVARDESLLQVHQPLSIGSTQVGGERLQRVGECWADSRAVALL